MKAERHGQPEGQTHIDEDDQRQDDEQAVQAALAPPVDANGNVLRWFDILDVHIIHSPSREEREKVSVQCIRSSSRRKERRNCGDRCTQREV